jgi:hypothetical protein
MTNRVKFRPFIFLCLSGLFAGKSYAVDWVPISGQILFGSTPLCSMVLANGQHTFSCDGSGNYNLSVPLDLQGLITLQVFTAGFAPYRQLLTPGQATHFTVNMLRDEAGRNFDVTYKTGPSAHSGDWVSISGTIDYDGTPLCAMVLINGQHIFSCGQNPGNYSLDAPLDSVGNVTLQVFAFGFQPFRVTLSDTAAFNLVTPYVNETDMREINDFFNAQYSDAPWGRIHDGLDIDPDGHLRPFQAACAGRVKKLYTFDDQVMLLIDCDSTYTIGYNFETQAPNTGQAQYDNVLVTEGQLVAQGEVIGHLYSAENPEDAHVHFTLYKDAVPICPAPYFTQAAHDSVLDLIALAHQEVIMCKSGDVTPPPLISPYFSESEMVKITAGFSSQYSVSPWNHANDGIDIYPQADLKRFQAACSGVVDAVLLQQADTDNTWQVEVAIACDDYVFDPDAGGYFIPLTTKYVFKTMSINPQAGQTQLNNISVSTGNSVTQGDTIGYLKVANVSSHLQFALWQFGQSKFQVFGVSGIPLCPEAQFTPQAKDSILNLLHVTWPNAGMCYQD